MLNNVSHLVVDAINRSQADALPPALELLSLRNIAYAILASLLIWGAYSYYLDSQYIPGFPIVGKPKGWDPRFTRTRYKFYFNVREVLKSAVKEYPNKVFQLISHSRPLLVISPDMFEDIRNSEDALAMEAAMTDFFPSYRPFDSFHNGTGQGVLINVVQSKLTPALALITEPVNDENNVAIQRLLGEKNEWTKTKFNPTTAEMISQVSSRIFLGKELCRNERWIQIGKDYTTLIMTAAFSMQLIPRFFRPLVWRLIPAMYQLQRAVNDGRKLIEPEVEKRSRAMKEALARGEKPPKHLDAIDWIVEVTQQMGVDYDVTAGQLGLTFAAVHTTSTTLTHLMYDIIEHGQDLIDDLRQEIVDVYAADGGWQKTSLQKLKLLDSVMKESQRYHPMGMMNQTRLATADIPLNNGETIPKGSRFYIHSLDTRSAKHFDDPETFNGRRFLEQRRQPGHEHKHQFVATSGAQNMFGHGKHACPGRFFASNELKLIVAHLLIKYDWRFLNGKRPAYLAPFQLSLVIDPDAEIEYKSRKPEIDF